MNSVDMECWCGAFTEGALSEESRESFVSPVQEPADEYDDQHRCDAETSRSWPKEESVVRFTPSLLKVKQCLGKVYIIL